MEAKYLEKYFINPAFEYGIKAYLACEQGKEYERIHTFEMHVIKVLTIIYGEKSILLPYKIDNEKAFECNLLIYDLKENIMKKFIMYMNEYYMFMKNYKSSVKTTGLIYEIENILIEMINKRAKRRSFTNKELAEFDKLFNPVSGDLKQLKKLLSNDDGLIIKNWQDSKIEISNEKEQNNVYAEELLSSEQYSKFGYDITKIASKNNFEILNINNKILQETQKKCIMAKQRIFHKNKIVLSSGNGFVDKLMLISIVATELMIGVIILSVLGG